MYIITCDKTNHILNISIPLLDKYWNIKKSVKILGFNKPDIEFSSDYEFISMGEKQLSIDNWAKDIYSVIKNDPNEFIIFGLDDHLIIDYVDKTILNLLFDEMKNNESIVRCTLGIDIRFLPHKLYKQFDDFQMIEQSEDSTYRITTQPSIWRKDYLLQFLNKSTNPWNFETNNNPKDGKIIIETTDKYSSLWMKETALSNRHPGKINILGLKLDDVKEFIHLGLLDTNSLIFGQHIGRVPEFNKYGYNFNLGVLKNYVNRTLIEEYIIRYGSAYK